MSRRVPVVQQLNELVHNIIMNIEHQMICEIDVTQWMVEDYQSTEMIHGMEEAIDVAFDQIMNEYADIPEVYSMLDNYRVNIQTAAWISINIPYPVNLSAYIERTLENLRFVVSNVTALQDCLIRANHRVEIIQRKWRTCISDPNYKICRNRLMREAEELINLRL